MAEYSESSRDDGVGVLRVAGEIDIAVAEELVAAARACLASHEGIVLDLSGVTFIDSSGLGALVWVRNEAGQQAKPLELAHVSAAVERLLEVTGLRDGFDLRTDPS